jgi:hypothetical protein
VIPFGEIVDTGALLSVVLASLAGGVGLTAGFSTSIFAATRSAERRRRGQSARAAILGLVAGAAGAACLALVAFGIYLIAS